MKAKWITPAVTAMDEEGHVDLEANKRIYDFLIEKGMDGILLLGSIGEFFAIPTEEKKALIREAIAHIDHRVTVYVGTNEMNFEACVELSNYALAQGADGVMVIAPYYFNLPDSAVLNFYDSLARRVNGPLLLYNFPDRTGYDLRPDLIYTLVSRHKNIVGIKDTVPTMGHTRAIIQKVKKEYPDFLVYSGFDEFFGHNVLSGGDGCVAGLSNLAPEIASGYADRARRDDLAGMREYQQKIDGLMAIYDVAPQFVPVIKKAMEVRGVPMKPYCAAPMLPATEEETKKIQEILLAQGLGGVRA
ncbi:MAG TPA: dihydrodipicolinate synthase family protein [Candidatus Limivivens intestinipullorum]|uniref:Dihydrodipicolinate synthase family protein n=1 Tax=Candidatus Limivivens intestinipullorum TaxID=2840858 RepID=A0A9D1JK27_9FIRM|nr:dihydrodipicolinate synthase family protein [Candidatus Limivivens intestinipullorum]